MVLKIGQTLPSSGATHGPAAGASLDAARGTCPAEDAFSVLGSRRNDMPDVMRPRTSVLPPPLRKELERVVLAGDVNSLQQQLQRGADAHGVAPAGREGSAQANRVLAMAQRLQSLWPAEQRQALQAGPEWMQALARYDFEAARALIQPLVPEGSAVAAWQSAMRERNADLAKGLLVLQPNMFAEVLRGIPLDEGAGGRSLNGQLHQALALGDPALSSHVKQYPYYSPKPERAEVGRFNDGEAKFPGTQDEVVCRHLALDWLEQVQASPSGKPDYQRFGSKESIAASVPQVREKQFDALQAHAVEAHLVEIDGWGEFAARQFQEMEAKGQSSKRMVIESSVHSMAVEFKLKVEDGRLQQVQNVYDPNLTTVHRRSRSEAPSAVALGASLRDFIASDARAQHDALGKDTLVSVFAIPEEGLDSLPAASQPRPADRRMSGRAAVVDAPGMFQLLRGGFSGDLADIGPEIVELSRQDAGRAFELLSAKNDEGIPGLYSALYMGAAQTVAIFADIVDRCALDPAQKMELLAAKHPDAQMPGLAAAMACDHAATADAFIAAVGRADLPENDKVGLLLARRPSGGAPLFCHAIEYFRPQTWRDYFAKVSRLPLSEVAKRRVFESRTPQGMPALQFAMRGGHAGAAGAIAQAILDASLRHETKLALLEARSPSGLNAYESALRCGRNDAARLYRDVVMRSSLTPGEKARLCG